MQINSVSHKLKAVSLRWIRYNKNNHVYNELHALNDIFRGCNYNPAFQRALLVKTSIIPHA